MRTRRRNSKANTDRRIMRKFYEVSVTAARVNCPFSRGIHNKVLSHMRASVRKAVPRGICTTIAS